MRKANTKHMSTTSKPGLNIKPTSSSKPAKMKPHKVISGPSTSNSKAQPTSTATTIPLLSKQISNLTVIGSVNFQVNSSAPLSTMPSQVVNPNPNSEDLAVPKRP